MSLTATREATTSAPETPSAPLVLPFGDQRPRIHADAWLAPGATVIGDVEMGADSSLWFGSVLRGDVHWIRIGERSNIQDQCVLHVTRGLHPTQVGNEVTVGHRAVVHGCKVGDGALIGIGAIVMDGAEVGAEALVAAGALVPPGASIPPGVLARGIPARVVRELSPDERAAQRQQALGYVETAKKYRLGDQCRLRPGSQFA